MEDKAIFTIFSNQNIRKTYKLYSNSNYGFTNTSIDYRNDILLIYGNNFANQLSAIFVEATVTGMTILSSKTY